ncbi:MAG: histidine kinase [Ahrensia sp.]|nr:histidine kinase [Ahrensia sp.]
MPSLFRFLIFLAVLGGLAYGGMFALATFVEPNDREMRVKIPSKKLNDRD